MPANRHWGEERWDCLCKQLCENFGPEAAAKIIETIVTTIGGERITLPNLQDIEMRARNRKICNLYRGDYGEIMARFNISINTVRRILKKQRTISHEKPIDT